MIPLSWGLGGVALTALAFGGMGEWHGYERAADHFRAEASTDLMAALAARDAAREQEAALRSRIDASDATVARGEAQTRERLRVEYRDRIRTVEKIIAASPVVYRGPECRVDDDGMHQLAAAVRTANAARRAFDSGQPPGAVPGTADAGGPDAR